LQTTERLSRRMHKGGYFPKAKPDNIWKSQHKTKKQRWHSFTLDDKVSVLYDVIIKKQKHSEVAKVYSRSRSHITKLVKKI